MNPLEVMVIRLGIYIGQLEQQVQDLHKQLVEKEKLLEAWETSQPAKGRPE